MRRMPAVAACVVWTAWLLRMHVEHAWDLFESYWPMTLTMVVGSFVAGATSEGGGAVAFPVMTLLFEIAPPVARDFSLAIQSVGMTAASLTILAMGVPVERTAILCGGLGGALGVVVGMEVLSPHIPGDGAKLFFVSVWLAFAWALHLMNRRHAGARHLTLTDPGRASTLGLLVATGTLGGCISGITGSGLDIVTFALLVLAFRIDERVATPTSVILMASNSLFAVGYRSLLGPPLAPAAIDSFWVCAPVVVVGAPLGARFIRDRSRGAVVSLLYVCIVAQYVTAMVLLTRGIEELALSLLVTCVALLFFLAASAYGRRRVLSVQPLSPEATPLEAA